MPLFYVNIGYYKQKCNTFSFILLLFTNFTGTLGYSIVLLFFVFFSHRFWWKFYSLCNTSFSISCLSIIWSWSDSYGRKKVLLLCNAGTLIGWIIFLYALFL